MHLGDLEDDARDKVSVLNRDIATQVVKPRMDLILNKYGQVKGLEDYLKQYAQDVIDNVELILEQEEDDFAPAMFNRVPALSGQCNCLQTNQTVVHRLF